MRFHIHTQQQQQQQQQHVVKDKQVSLVPRLSPRPDENTRLSPSFSIFVGAREEPGNEATNKYTRQKLKISPACHYQLATRNAQKWTCKYIPAIVKEYL